MALITDIPTYTFAGVTFNRIVSGDDFPRWFPINATYKADPILDSSRQYVDIGGSVPQSLQIRAEFDTSADRASTLDAVTTFGTLEKSTGESRTVLLAVAVPLPSDAGLRYVADLTFVPV